MSILEMELSFINHPNRRSFLIILAMMAAKSVMTILISLKVLAPSRKFNKAAFSKSFIRTLEKTDTWGNSLGKLLFQIMCQLAGPGDVMDWKKSSSSFLSVLYAKLAPSNLYSFSCDYSIVIMVCCSSCCILNFIIQRFQRTGIPEKGRELNFQSVNFINQPENYRSTK